MKYELLAFYPSNQYLSVWLQADGSIGTDTDVVGLGLFKVTDERGVSLNELCGVCLAEGYFEACDECGNFLGLIKHDEPLPEWAQRRSKQPVYKSTS